MVPIEIEVIRIYKNWKEMTNTISCRLQFASSLSTFVIDIAAGIHKIKCKYGHDDKKCEICGVKYKDYLQSFIHKV